MGGRWTDDDDTHERLTDTNRLTRHTASWLPHTLSWRIVLFGLGWVVGWLREGVEDVECRAL